MPFIKYQRPEPQYVTKTSTINANRFQEEAQKREPLKASDLDQEFNALIDNDNDLSAKMEEFVAGIFPGGNEAENLNKVVYSDGTGAKWKKLTSENISDNAITSPKISNNAVIREKVAIGAIGTDNLIDRNVTNSKLGDASVDTRVLANSSVTTAKIQTGSVTADKLAVNSVTTEKILDNSVTTSKFADGSFTTNKLADKSLTPRKTNNCFLLGELKFSIIEPGCLSYASIQEGWIPISLPRADGYGGINVIPADCFPELKKRLRDYEHSLSGTTRYISIKKHSYQNNAFLYFDFNALVGAYPMLIGATLMLRNENYLQRYKELDVSDAPLEALEAEELTKENFTTWNIPQNALRDYVNGTIETANANYDFTGYQQHQTPRRFGEETIAIGLENMPKHSHKIMDNFPRVIHHRNNNNPPYPNAQGFRVIPANQIQPCGTYESGDSKPLPHLPPSIALYGYIYGGDYDPNGWPYFLRTK